MTLVQLALASRSKVSALVQMKMLLSTVLDSVSSFPDLDDDKCFFTSFGVQQSPDR